MAVFYGVLFAAEPDQVFPQVVHVMGELAPVAKGQSQEDEARDRPVRPRTDEFTGRPIYKFTIADPAAEKDRAKSITVEIADTVRSVQQATVGNLPSRPAILKGLTGQPRAEITGHAKWITWMIRTIGLRVVDASPAKNVLAKPAAA